MRDTAAAADLTRENWLGLLVDREVAARDTKRLSRRLTQARLQQNAVVETTNFRTPRGLERALFHKRPGRMMRGARCRCSMRRTVPSVPMTVRQRPPGSLDPQARKDPLIHAHAPRPD